MFIPEPKNEKGAYLHMKKILSVLLALTMLLVPVLAMAEAAQAVTYQSYTHTDDQYTIEYADNWLMLNAELISTILNTMDTSEDEQLALLVNTYGPQIQQMDMALVGLMCCQMDILVQLLMQQKLHKDILVLYFQK